MAKQIKGSDIFEGDIFKVVVDGAEVAKEKLKELNTELVNVGKSFKTELKGIKADNVKEIEALIKKTKELTDAVKLQTQTTIEQQKIERELNKTKEQLAREKEKTKREELKTQEQINRQQQKQIDLTKKESDAYKELVKNTRELKNESKRLGAEMLALEQAGQKNSKEYARLSRTYKDVTASAKQGDEALKKLDARVGDNFRNVGNYEKGVARLKNVLSQLGLAFGGVTIVRNLIDTQVQLDSLKLALQNVSKSTNEYQANLSFLKDISNSYGQDLIVMIDSYKNFIASTESSNLSLKERKKVYESVIKAGSSLALTNDQMKGSLLAISQMFSKGAVSAEELRQQLGERLPGAFSIMAESMGVSEKKLAEMMKNGEVMADDVMPNFARALNEHFGENAKKRLETLGGAWNLLKNKVTEFVDTTQKGVGINKTFAFVLRAIAENIGTLLSSVRLVIQSYITYKGVLLGLQLIEKVRNGTLKESIMLSLQTTRTSRQMAVAQGEVATATSVASKEFRLFGMTLKSIGWMAILGVLTEVSVKIFNIVRGVEDAQRVFDSFNQGDKIGRQNASKFLSELDKKQQKIISNYREEQLELKRTGKITKEQFSENVALKRKELDMSNDRKKALTDEIKRLNEERKQREALLEDFKKSGGQNKVTGVLAFADYVVGLVGKENAEKLGLTAKGYTSPREAYLEERKEIHRINTELTIYNQELSDIREKQNGFGGEVKKSSKDVLEHTKAVKDINTEYKTTNEYLDKQIELLQRLNQIVADRTISGAEANTQQVIQNELELAGKTGRYSDRSVANAVQREVKIRLDAEEKYYESIEKLDDEYIKNK